MTGEPKMAGDPAKAGRLQGRFQRGRSGNPAGAKPGTRHKALLALDAIGERSAQAVLQRVVQDALSGDVRSADILLRRLWPERKGRPVTIDLPPIHKAADLPMALGALIDAIRIGHLSVEEAAGISTLLEQHRRAFETAELEGRIAALEILQPAPDQGHRP